MSKAPAFQFYPSDLAPDLDPLTMEERGMYLTLMRNLWTSGGPIMLDEVEALIQKPWLSAGSIFRRKFREKDGAVTLIWMEEQREKQARFRELQAEKGKKGGRPRKEEKPSLNKAFTKIKPKESPRVGDGDREGDSIQRGKERATDRFETLWEAYGRIGSKPDAMGYWLKLPEVDKMAIEAKLPAYVASTPGGKFRKHLQGWINPKHRYWESAIVSDAPTTERDRMNASISDWTKPKKSLRDLVMEKNERNRAATGAGKQAANGN